jgi:hypothetical protein
VEAECSLCSPFDPIHSHKNAVYRRQNLVFGFMLFYYLRWSSSSFLSFRYESNVSGCCWNSFALYIRRTERVLQTQSLESVSPSVRLALCASPSVCLSVCLSVSLCVRLSVRPSVWLSVRPSGSPSVRQSLCLSASLCLSVCLSVSLCVRLSVRLSASLCPSVRLSVCLSVCLSSVSVRPSVHPSARPSVCLSVFVSPSVRPSVPPSVCLFLRPFTRFLSETTLEFDHHSHSIVLLTNLSQSDHTKHLLLVVAHSVAPDVFRIGCFVTIFSTYLCRC